MIFNNYLKTNQDKELTAAKKYSLWQQANQQDTAAQRLTRLRTEEVLDDETSSTEEIPPPRDCLFTFDSGVSEEEVPVLGWFYDCIDEQIERECGSSSSEESSEDLMDVDSEDFL